MWKKFIGPKPIKLTIVNKQKIMKGISIIE